MTQLKYVTTCRPSTAGLATTFAAVPLINCIYPPHLMREDHNRQVIEQQQATVSVSASPDVTSLSPVDLEAESEGFFPEEGLTRSGNMAEESKRHTAAAPPMLRRNVVCLASDPLQAASLTTVAALLTGGLLAATECIPVPLEPTIAASQPPAQDAPSPSQVLLMHCKLASEVRDGAHNTPLQVFVTEPRTSESKFLHPAHGFALYVCRWRRYACSPCRAGTGKRGRKYPLNHASTLPPGHCCIR